MTIDRRRDEDRWKLDKHIPVAVILAMLGQGVGLIWWVSGIQYVTQDHERRLVAHEASKIAERMAVVELQVRDSRDLSVQMNTKLDKLIEQRGSPPVNGAFGYSVDFGSLSARHSYTKCGNKPVAAPIHGLLSTCGPAGIVLKIRHFL